MIKYISFFLFLVVSLTSCFKEDDPIPPHPKGDLEEVVIPMTLYYVNQVYFSLPGGEQVSINQKNDFDLSFSCADSASVIRLNTSTFMTAAVTDFSDLEQVTDTVGLVWKFDKSDGNPDSTALNGWINIDVTDTVYLNKVFVINRGINAAGFNLGLRKAIFTELNAGHYHFTWSNMDNTSKQEVVIEKDRDYNYTQYSFDSQTVVQLEPSIPEWDLLFTQYSTLLFTDAGEAYPYLVTGTLINPHRTLVAFDSTMTFNDIELNDVLFLDYSANLDIIGYEWKSVVGDVESGDFYYKTESGFNYIIKSQAGIFYKLHFTGFYNTETGVKGYPAFEFQRL